MWQSFSRKRRTYVTLLTVGRVKVCCCLSKKAGRGKQEQDNQILPWGFVGGELRGDNEATRLFNPHLI